MKILLFTSFIYFIVGNAFAMLNFEKYTIGDKLTEGTASYDFVFKFKNDGNTIMRITDIKTDCGCTVIKNTKDKYEPNELGEIKGIFNIGDRIGLQKKKIFIQTDNLGQPKIELSLELKIEPLITIRPSLVFWKKGSDISEKTVSVIFCEQIKPEMISIESDNENIMFQKVAECNTTNSFYLKIKTKSTSESLSGTIKVNVKNSSIDKSFRIQCVVK